MDRDQERKHLAEAERHIAQAQKRVARQRQIVEAARDRGRPSDEGEVLLQIFERNLRTLEGHRQLIVERLEAEDSRSRRRRGIAPRWQNTVGPPQAALGSLEPETPPGRCRLRPACEPMILIALGGANTEKTRTERTRYDRCAYRTARADLPAVASRA
jgi:hypothetical protein